MTEGPTCAACNPDQARDLIDAFVTQNFDRLQRIAAGIAKSRSRADDLFSYLVDQIYSGRPSVAAVVVNGHGDMLAWCTKVMKTSVHSKTSGFRSWSRKHPDQPGAEADAHGQSDGYTADESAPGSGESDSRLEAEFDLQPEMVDPPRSFREQELREQGMHQGSIDTLLALEACKHCLPPHMSELFSLYFEQGKTIREVSVLKGMPSTSVFGQVGLLRRRLEDCMSTKQKPLL